MEDGAFLFIGMNKRRDAWACRRRVDSFAKNLRGEGVERVEKFRRAVGSVKVVGFGFGNQKRQPYVVGKIVNNIKHAWRMIKVIKCGKVLKSRLYLVGLFAKKW